MNLPTRKSLPHDAPDWVRAGEIFFITLCAAERGENSLCVALTAGTIFSAAEHYQNSHRWHVRLLVLMPDHLHMLVAFPRAESMRKVITGWKHFIARHQGIRWQRDFFDHRLRSHESLDEKAHYIRQNPVRAGLVANASAWPFVWEPR